MFWRPWAFRCTSSSLVIPSEKATRNGVAGLWSCTTGASVLAESLLKERKGDSPETCAEEYALYLEALAHSAAFNDDEAARGTAQRVGCDTEAIYLALGGGRR